MSVGYGRLELDAKESENAITRTELENNVFYDVRELGKTNGEIVIRIEDDTVTEERAEQILREIKDIFDTLNVGFYKITFTLKYPASEGNADEHRSDDIRYEDILYENIK